MASILTQNNILDVIESVQVRHPSLNSFFVGKEWDFTQNNSKQLYPAVQVYFENPYLPEGEGTYGAGTYPVIIHPLRINIVNQLNNDLSNDRYIYSDAAQFVQDIINEISTHPFYVRSNASLTGDIELEELEEYTQNNLAGYSAVIRFRLKNNNSFCGLPLEEIEGFDFPGATSTGYTYSRIYLTCGNLSECDSYQNIVNQTINSNVVSGATFISGGTNLYDIFLTTADGNDITRVQPGINTYTGGTANFPTINITGGTFYSLSASSLSADTYYSGSTPLQNVISTIVSGITSGITTTISPKFIGYGNSLSGLTGTSTFQFDTFDAPNGGRGIYLNQTSPSGTNFSLANYTASGGITVLNAPAGKVVMRVANGSDIFNTDATSGFWNTPKAGFGGLTTGMSAGVDIQSGNTYASLRIRSGSTAIPSPNNGDIWNEGHHFVIPKNGLRLSTGATLGSQYKLQYELGGGNTVAWGANAPLADANTLWMGPSPTASNYTLASSSIGTTVLNGAQNVSIYSNNTIVGNFFTAVNFTPLVNTTGAAAKFSFATPADTTQTAGAETTAFSFNHATLGVQHATGTIPLNRDFLIDPRVHRFVAASTITDAVTLYVSAPSAGTNTTITNGYSIWANNSSRFATAITQTMIIASATGTTSGSPRMAEAASNGVISATKTIISAYITDQTAIGLLTATTNWNILSVYTGTTLTNVYAGQIYRDLNYKYEMYTDTEPLRLARV